MSEAEFRRLRGIHCDGGAGGEQRGGEKRDKEDQFFHGSGGSFKSQPAGMAISSLANGKASPGSKWTYQRLERPDQLLPQELRDSRITTGSEREMTVCG